MAAPDDGVSRKQVSLCDVIADHRQELVRSLNTNTLFLTYLAKHRIIEPADILKYEHYREKEARNTAILDLVSKREADLDDCYSKFIDALKRSDQEHIAAMLTDIHKELQIVGKYQALLEDNLSDIHNYLQKESRRVEVHFSTVSPVRLPPIEATPADGVTADVADLLFKVHDSTRSTIVHFDRCREVIDKLHTDCETVSRKNVDLLGKLRECDTLVKHVAPSYARKEFEARQTDKMEALSVTSGGSVHTRSRMNEADTLIESVKHAVSSMAEEKRIKEDEEREAINIVDNIIRDVKIRRQVLDKCTEAPPCELYKYKYTKTRPGENGEASKPRTNLKARIMDLAEEMPLYVQQESQVTHKNQLGRLQRAAGANHRNFDQIEHDIMHLEKEVRRGEHARAATLLKQVAEATRTEREDCMRLVDDICRVVRVRRLKLEEISAGNRPKKKAMVKRRTTRTLNTNFAVKLNETDREIRTYMDQEIDLMARHKEDTMKRKQEYEAELYIRAAEARQLEFRIRELDLERDKYKKLYEHEKAVKETHMLTKALIPKRINPDRNEGAKDADNVKVEVSYQRPTPKRQSSRKTNVLQTKSKISAQNTRSNKTTRRSTRTRESLSRPTGQGAASGTYPIHPPAMPAKPRLTPRAKHLTKLKATVRERHNLSIPAPIVELSVRNL